jgi:hypothetical protein
MDAYQQVQVTAPGRELHRRFLALGDMTGKTADEIIAVVGRPVSISSMAAGQTLLQWQATGCHMALLFGPDGKFLKITHQYANYAVPPAGCATLATLLLLLLAMIGVAALRL